MNTTANEGDEQDNICPLCGDHKPCDCDPFPTIRHLAAELAAGFVGVPDGEADLTRNGCRVRVLTDATRERFQEVCHKAHGEMFPDDWRYSMIEEVADILADSESEEEYRDRISEAEAPIYNAELLGYIGSHGARFNGYAEDAMRDYQPDSFIRICGMAWHLEFEEVASLLFDALGEMAQRSG